MIATESFLNSVENPEQNVNNRLDDEKRIGTSLNLFRKPSFSVVDSALPCEEIVLNGASRGITGNFLVALQMMANHDNICMGQERLSFLHRATLMHIHYQVKIDLDEVVNLFATKHPRRLELGTILRD